MVCLDTVSACELREGMLAQRLWEFSKQQLLRCSAEQLRLTSVLLSGV